jgi:hypothetical protein
MHRLITGAVSAYVVVGAVACGGSSSTPSGSKATTIPSMTSSAVLTPQRAQALAAAAILKSSDMPGYVAKSATHSASDAQAEQVAQRCLGVPSPHYLARNFGMAFTKGDTEVDSSADVASSAAEARSQLRALTGSKAPNCLKTTLAGALASSGGTIRTFSATPVPVSITGADASFGYQFRVVADFGGHSVNLAGYEVGTLVGQVEIDVQVTGTAPLPLTFARIQQLAQTATTRERSAG